MYLCRIVFKKCAVCRVLNDGKGIDEIKIPIVNLLKGEVKKWT